MTIYQKRGGIRLNQTLQPVHATSAATSYHTDTGAFHTTLISSSSYPHTDETGAKEITTYIQNDARTVDYIWYTNHDNTPQNCARGQLCNELCRVSVLLCDATVRLLTKPELGAMGRLRPKEKYGSDHQAIQSWFTIYGTSLETRALVLYILPLPVAPLVSCTPTSHMKVCYTYKYKLIWTEVYRGITGGEYPVVNEGGRYVLGVILFQYLGWGDMI
eukprot:sb/3479577/